MQVIRNGELWFSTLEEALAEASRRRDVAGSAISPAYAGFIRAGALAILGWRALKQLVFRS
jgi:hypothetical protein